MQFPTTFALNVQSIYVSTAAKIKELTEQRKLLTADLETNLQALQMAQAYTPGHAEEIILPGE